LLDIPLRYTVNSQSSNNTQIESGGCSLVSTARINMKLLIICNNPSSSVFFDGVIPSVSNNTDWESQVLRLRSYSTITFDMGNIKVSTVEIVLYNSLSRNK